MRDPPTWRELLAALGILSGVGVLLYGRHVVRGGLYSDDWDIASIAEHGDGPLSEYRALRASAGFRPLGVALLVIRFSLLNGHAHLHLAVVLASTVVLCAAIYLLLRSLRIEPLHAGAIALLALACPYADATRLWATASGANIAITLWVLGVVVALRGLAAETTRGAIALHACAVGLYLASVLQGEIAYAAICGTGLLYLTQAGIRRVLPRSAVDIAVTSAAVVVMVSRSAIPKTQSYLDHARLMLDGGVQILADVVIPFGDPRPSTVIVLLGAVLAAATVAIAVLPRHEATRTDLLRWLAVGGGGLAVAVAGWSIFIGADEWYQPLGLGLANRTNAVGSLGLIVTAYAAVASTAILLVRPLSRSRALAGVVTVGIAAVLFGGYQDRLRESAAVWDRTWDEQKRILFALQTSLPTPPSSATIYTFGHPVLSENVGLPIFFQSWELRGAVQVVFDNPTIKAYPAPPGASVVCTPEGAHIQGGGYTSAVADIYGDVFLVDIPSGRVERIETREECLAVGSQFRPGPLQVSDSP